LIHFYKRVIKMPSIDIYGMPLSAPCRIVQMTAECLGIEYNFKLTDLMKGEHMTPEFLKMNPQHNIPTVVDGDLNLNESRAIATYLVNKYGENDKLYPKEAVARYHVDRLLYFDMGVLYKAFADVAYPKMMKDMPQPQQKHHDRLHEVLGWLDSFVADDKFAAGTAEMTLADIALVATFSTIKACGVTDLSKYANTEKWLAKCEGLIPNYAKANGEGAEAMGGWFKNA
jgi:glutathione S-transferase